MNRNHMDVAPATGEIEAAAQMMAGVLGQGFGQVARSVLAPTSGITRGTAFGRLARLLLSLAPWPNRLLVPLAPLPEAEDLALAEDEVERLDAAGELILNEAVQLRLAIRANYYASLMTRAADGCPLAFASIARSRFL
jgi:hypothetical protein